MVLLFYPPVRRADIGPGGCGHEGGGGWILALVHILFSDNFVSHGIIQIVVRKM